MADPTARQPSPSSTDAAGRGTPYGPHPHGVDEAAGGADSSPLDNEPSGDERLDTAERERAAGKTLQGDPANR